MSRLFYRLGGNLLEGWIIDKTAIGLTLTYGENSVLIELEIPASDVGYHIDALLAFGLVPVPRFTRCGSVLGYLLGAFHTTDKGSDGQGPDKSEDIF